MDKKDPREDDPNFLKFKRYRPLSEMADDMIKGSGMTHNDGMRLLTGILGKVVEAMTENDDERGEE